MLVGEMPSDNEVAEGKPFVGPSGFLLNELLHGGGLIRTECFTTNVVRFQAPNNDATAFVEYRKTKGIEKGMAYYKGKWVTPFVPEHIQHLEREIHEVNPNLIVALGNIAQWALTGIDGVTDWPRTKSTLRRVADRLSALKETGVSPGPARYFWPGQPLRNAFFLSVVLFHGFRRLLPPY